MIAIQALEKRTQEVKDLKQKLSEMEKRLEALENK